MNPSLENLHSILAARHEESPKPVSKPDKYSLVEAGALDTRDSVTQLLESADMLELHVLFNRLAKADLSQKAGRREFVDASVQSRASIGKTRSTLGKKTPNFSIPLIACLRKNPSLSALFHADSNARIFVDVRKLTPKVVSALRHLTKEFDLDLHDGMSHEYDDKQQMSRMRVDLGNGEEVVGYAPFDINKQKKKSRKQFSRDNMLDFMAQTKQQGSWVLIIGHSEHKLNQEFIAIPEVEKLIRIGGNEFLFAVNTFINSVLNDNKGVVPGREKLSARVVRVPEEVGEDYLSGLKVVGDFPMVHLGQLGQQLVLKVDKTNHDKFDLVRQSLS
jgi:hypothetical protein